MQKPDPMAHGPLTATSSTQHVEEHLHAIADHLGAVLWEHALAIVRAAESDDPHAAAEAKARARLTMETLTDRVAEETGQLVTSLADLRRRSRGEEPALPPAPAPQDVETDEHRGGPSRRASLHESPLQDLFQRTD